MIFDLNKGISNIIYNHLNLPTEIVFSGTGTKKINYIYNAAGVKVQKKVTNGTSVMTTDYLDGFQYFSNVLQFFPTAEGYVKNTVVSNQNTYDYVYNYTDHLGNIRLSYMKDPTTGNLKILEENHYYPFGLKHSRYAPLIGRMAGINNDTDKAIQAVDPNDQMARASLYKYKYNGKEYQDELELNMYDMDMRLYDPAIARWVVRDPVIHHSLSPYNAFDNNPVFWADPSGADSESNGGETPNATLAFGVKLSSIAATSSSGFSYVSSDGKSSSNNNSRSGNNNGTNDPNKKPNNSNTDSKDKGDSQVLKNDSDKTIYFKPEDKITFEGKTYEKDGAYPLEPGRTWEHGFDGVAAPHIAEGSIFKASDGVSVTVTNENISWSGGDIFSKAAMVVGNIASMSDKTGGWKTEDWINKLSANTITTNNYSWKTGEKWSTSTTGVGDKSWINLFDKSGLQNAQSYQQPHTYYQNNFGW